MATEPASIPTTRVSHSGVLPSTGKITISFTPRVDGIRRLAFFVEYAGSSFASLADAPHVVSLTLEWSTRRGFFLGFSDTYKGDLHAKWELEGGLPRLWAFIHTLYFLLHYNVAPTRSAGEVFRVSGPELLSRADFGVALPPGRYPGEVALLAPGRTVGTFIGSTCTSASRASFNSKILPGPKGSGRAAICFYTDELTARTCASELIPRPYGVGAWSPLPFVSWLARVSFVSLFGARPPGGNGGGQVRFNRDQFRHFVFSRTQGATCVWVVVGRVLDFWCFGALGLCIRWFVRVGTTVLSTRADVGLFASGGGVPTGAVHQLDLLRGILVF